MVRTIGPTGSSAGGSDPAGVAAPRAEVQLLRGRGYRVALVERGDFRLWLCPHFHDTASKAFACPAVRPVPRV